MQKKYPVLFLTNNENSRDLFLWLKEKNEEVYLINEKITSEIVQAYSPKVMISFNYKYMIPKDIIDMMQGQIFNLHISLLPYNRGASPNFFSFIENTPKGVTIHQIDEGLDTGPILAQKELFFDESKETFASGYEKLILEIQMLFKENWSSISDKNYQLYAQTRGGTFHTSDDFKRIYERFPFSWNDNILAYKKKWRRIDGKGGNL
mgnify:FL=1